VEQKELQKSYGKLLGQAIKNMNEDDKLESLDTMLKAKKFDVNANYLTIVGGISKLKAYLGLTVDDYAAFFGEALQKKKSGVTTLMLADNEFDFDAQSQKIGKDQQLFLRKTVGSIQDRIVMHERGPREYAVQFNPLESPDVLHVLKDTPVLSALYFLKKQDDLGKLRVQEVGRGFDFSDSRQDFDEIDRHNVNSTVPEEVKSVQDLNPEKIDPTEQASEAKENISDSRSHHADDKRGKVIEFHGLIFNIKKLIKFVIATVSNALKVVQDYFKKMTTKEQTPVAVANQEQEQVATTNKAQNQALPMVTPTTPRTEQAQRKQHKRYG
jgi:hypothetical protein